MLRLSDQLSGENAFFNQPDYLEKTKADYYSYKGLTTFKWQSGCKFWRELSITLSWIIFPIGLYKLIHTIVFNKYVLQSTDRQTRLRSLKVKQDFIESGGLAGEWVYKRIKVNVNGTDVDATIMGKRSTIGNGRWILASLGNAETYEHKLDFRGNGLHIRMLNETNSNLLIYNYQGAAESRGRSSRQTTTNTYRAMLNFLEDQKKGIGAKEIIGYAFSLGGGVQAEALNKHKLKKDIKYVFVKDKTFRQLHKVIVAISNKCVGFLTSAFNINLDTEASSKKLKSPEIIIQSARVKEPEVLHDSTKIVHDGIFPPEVTLAKALLDDKNCPQNNKVFIGVPESHNCEMSNSTLLSETINTMLAAQ